MKKSLIAFFGIFVSILSCEKKEQEVPISSVSINKTTAELLIGETVQLSVTISPADATQKKISWTSSNQAVASVSGNGMVTAIAEGTSTITASCGGKSATCQVTVSKGYVAVASVTLNKAELTIEKGKTETLTATVSPSNATDQTVIWSSSQTEVATVDANGKVTAAGGGSAIITAKAGDKQATCSVTVTVPVESISISVQTLLLKEGDNAVIEAIVKPVDATNKSITWSSSNLGIVSIDNDGKVTAVSKGEAILTAVANDGTEVSATCSIIVYRIDTPTALDLGLSVKWASFNIGASAPEEYGVHYAWGETELKSNYSWSTYKWCYGSKDTIIKYNTKITCGPVDNKTVLEVDDDVAHKYLGGRWRMPTWEEWIELLEKCTWMWTAQSGVNGLLVTSSDGESIFLPAAGGWSDTTLYGAGDDCWYWSSTLSSSEGAFAVHYTSTIHGITSLVRYSGVSIRPVIDVKETN